MPGARPPQHQRSARGSPADDSLGMAAEGAVCLIEGDIERSDDDDDNNNDRDGKQQTEAAVRPAVKKETTDSTSTSSAAADTAADDDADARRAAILRQGRSAAARRPHTAGELPHIPTSSSSSSSASSVRRTPTRPRRAAPSGSSLTPAQSARLRSSVLARWSYFLRTCLQWRVLKHVLAALLLPTLALLGAAWYFLFVYRTVTVEQFAGALVGGDEAMVRAFLQQHHVPSPSTGRTGIPESELDPAASHTMLDPSTWPAASSAGPHSMLSVLSTPIPGDPLGRLPLHLALLSNSSRVVQTLIDAGAAVDARDELGSTGLHYACSMASGPLVLLLLEHGADVDAVDSVGRTPLHLAALTNCVPCMSHLVFEAGADLRVRAGGEASRGGQGQVQGEGKYATDISAERHGGPLTRLLDEGWYPDPAGHMRVIPTDLFEAMREREKRAWGAPNTPRKVKRRGQAHAAESSAVAAAHPKATVGSRSEKSTTASAASGSVGGTSKPHTLRVHKHKAGKRGKRRRSTSGDVPTINLGSYTANPTLESAEPPPTQQQQQLQQSQSAPPPPSTPAASNAASVSPPVAADADDAALMALFTGPDSSAESARRLHAQVEEAAAQRRRAQEEAEQIAAAGKGGIDQDEFDM